MLENNPQEMVRQESRNSQGLANESVDTPRIQLVILLDTSGSMDGLIDQTRNQLWQMVNEFSAARKDGVVPVLEIALFEYGNNALAESSGYLRKLSGFTRELDAVSEGLFSLTTNGGEEYCGYAIKSAVNNLQWSQSDSDVKAIFIAGNESFAQGPVDYREAAKLAARNGIAINTIHAGSHQTGVEDEWETGALLAGGSYMNIDADQKVVHIVAPQDKKIAELNAKLNTTYIPYGSKGAEKVQRQVEQDAMSSNISAGLLAKRAKSKSSAFYSNAGWDLVDALKEAKIDEVELTKLDEAELPDSMKALSAKERVEYVRKKTDERNLIKEEIAKQSQLRTEYVAKMKQQQAAASPSMGDALTKAVKRQAEQKSFVFEKQE
ncbi:MAG: VWA domain-containing protein [Candidatus Thiodiazotropha sp.]